MGRKHYINYFVYYLGLDYRRKVASILKNCGDEHTEFSKENMRAIMMYEYTRENMQQFMCLIERAEICFEKAQIIAKNNILWKGYILYNKIRVDIMKYLVGEGKVRAKKELINDLSNIIQIRENVCFLFQREGSYLDMKFKEEVERVRMLKNNFENSGMK